MERERLEDPDVDNRIVLRSILKKCDVREVRSHVWSGFSLWKGSFEHGNEPF
jgi:hypothetical protein